LLAGLSYLLVAAAPPDLRQKVPPIVLQWLPFGISFVSIGILGWGILAVSMGLGVPGWMQVARYAYPVLCFALLLRLTRPEDPYARWVIGAAAALHLVPLIGMLGDGFGFGAGALIGLVGLLQFLVFLLAAACVVFVPPLAMKPQFRSVDAFAPLACAVLVAWPVAQLLLFF